MSGSKILLALPVFGLYLASVLNTVAWQSDNGDGTFTNPPLYADYPDPDIIRVGEDFFFVTTTFVNSPGLTILHSKDLVNWEFASHVVPRLDGNPKYDLADGGDYRRGFFAASLRYHDGVFYIAVTPVGQNTRVYYSTNISGRWQYHLLNRAAFDPGLFIEDDGKGYIATSSAGDGTLTLLTLNSNYSQVVSDQNVYYNRGAEGSKIVKRNGWYYLFNAVPSYLGLTCSRATNIFGPWETIKQIDDRTGGHQGAIVDLPDGRDYGFVMKDCGAVGRMTYISPIFWTNGWPMWGRPDAPGRVPEKAPKPIQGQPFQQLLASDDFNARALGPQWQWNHNPDDSRWSLTERPGFLRLKPTTATNFWLARNTLTQKGQGPWCRGEVRFDLSHIKAGDICGLGTLGKMNGHIALVCEDGGKTFLRMNVTVDSEKSEARVADEPFDNKEIYLRTEMDFKRNKGLCAYSIDGKTWTPLGGEFELRFDWRTGTFQGEQFAIFCYNSKPDAGYIDVDYFHFVDTPTDAEGKNSSKL